MSDTILQQLKNHLASITPEQFKKEWDEIKKMGLEGPSVEDFVYNMERTDAGIKKRLIYMDKSYVTFQGKVLKTSEIDHQHLSNIIWYNTVILKKAMVELKEWLDLLRSNYNGQLLPYRPHVDFGWEISELRCMGMLRNDNSNPNRIIIFGEGREIGEIVCTSVADKDWILYRAMRLHDTVKEEAVAFRAEVPSEPLRLKFEYDPKESRQYHVSFDMIRNYYKKNVEMRPTLKRLFIAALENIDKEIIEDEKKKFLDSKKFVDFGVLLRRKNHPLNVYVVQRDGKGSVGIYNITHGQWWGNLISVNNLKDALHKSVNTAEFEILCGSHNPDNFYIFDEAMKHIK